MSQPLSPQQHQAVMRLQTSRLALAVASQAHEQALTQDGPGLQGKGSFLSDVMGEPIRALLSQTLGQLAQGHPWGLPMAMLGQGLRQGAATAIRRHPLLSMAVGLMAGALLITQRRRAWSLVGLYALPSVRTVLGRALSTLWSPSSLR